MTELSSIAGLIGDVFYHLSCPNHGDLGTSTTPEAASAAAAAHIRASHVDVSGLVAAGASVLVAILTHVTPQHLDAIDAAQQPSGLPGSHPGA